DAIFDELALTGRVKYNQTKIEGLHPGRTATVTLDRRPIGFIGQVHPSRAKAFDINETYVFEVDLEAVFSAKIEPSSYEPLPRYPSVTRDIALVIDEDVAAANIQSVIRQAGG